jgi:hypothetical protein
MYRARALHEAGDNDVCGVVSSLGASSWHCPCPPSLSAGEPLIQLARSDSGGTVVSSHPWRRCLGFSWTPRNSKTKSRLVVTLSMDLQGAMDIVGGTSLSTSRRGWPNPAAHSSTLRRLRVGGALMCHLGGSVGSKDTSFNHDAVREQCLASLSFMA